MVEMDTSIFSRLPSVYSRAELVSDAAVHALGILSALIGVPVLITLSGVWFGDGETLFAAFVYGFSLIAMFTCSAIYNVFPAPNWKDWLRRMDQSAIYLKIAGSYTPFVVLTGNPPGQFLAGVWGAAIVGVVLIVIGPKRFRWPSLVLYLAIGWAGAVAGQPMMAALSPAGFTLILVAGFLYSLGVIFLLWERLPFHNTIWHVFVLAASWIIYAAVVVELWGRAPIA